MKKIITLVFIALAIVACEDTEQVIYNQSTDQVLVSFDAVTFNQALEVGTEETVEFEVSTTSNVADKTISVTVNAESTANPSNYSVPSTVVIPAGEYFSSLPVTFTGTEEEQGGVLILDLVEDSGNNIVVGSSLTINISVLGELAPFTGNYLIEQTSTLIDGPTLSSGEVVELVYVSETLRYIMTANYPDYCTTPVQFYIGFVDGEILVPVQPNACPCADGTDWFGPADMPETYEDGMDDEFFVTFKDDVQEDCGPVAETTYKFTKQ